MLDLKRKLFQYSLIFIYISFNILMMAYIITTK